MDKKLPSNWEHKTGYHLNGAGKSIDYKHKSKGLKAVLEAMDDENNEESSLIYYTVIFDVSDGRPWETVEDYEFFSDKDKAKDHLYDLMFAKN